MIPVLVAALLTAASPNDTVYTVDGGRIAGTVLEESPTSGVTIQTPDGTIRRIEPRQVSRIEFADGTVSAPRPAPAPPAEAAPAPRPPASAGPVDTVHLSPSGRVRGTVMEESATTGVRIRRLDGSTQTYAPEELARVEYADGTVSTPRAAPAGTRAPAPAPRESSAQAQLDTVYFLGGGRVRGTVIEEHPRSGVKVRLLDGTYQTYARDGLVRIEYADGSVSRRKTPEAVPSAVPAAPPQPAPSPPPPAQAKQKAQAFPLYLALGVGATFLGGDAAAGVPMSGVLETEQAHVSSELGLRFSPHLALGVYGELGAGDPTSATRDQCQTQAIDCVGMTGRYGFLVRHTWEPLSTRPKWLSLGTGWEFGGVGIEHRRGNDDSYLFRYRGREYVRLGAGIDFRSNAVLGFGLYGTVSVGEYDELETPTTNVSVEGDTHTTAQLGVRLTLFP